MIILNIDQGTTEWEEARIGLPSASVFDMLITTKGEVSKQRDKLLYKLVGEKIIGRKEESYINSAMQRGIELEPEARNLFELITGLKVQQVGLCYKDENKDFACSPDGLIGEDEGLEIKCPSLAIHVEYLLSEKLPSSYFQQVQSSLYITGRKRWHFFSYYPEIKPLHIIVERDEDWILRFEKILNEFVADLKKVYNSLIN